MGARLSAMLISKKGTRLHGLLKPQTGAHFPALLQPYMGAHLLHPATITDGRGPTITDGRGPLAPYTGREFFFFFGK